MKGFVINHESELECYGKYESGTPRKHDRFFDKWSEPIGPDVKDFKVFKWVDGVCKDVTEMYSKSEIEELKNEWVTTYEDEQEPEYENDDAS